MESNFMNTVCNDPKLFRQIFPYKQNYQFPNHVTDSLYVHLVMYIIVSSYACQYPCLSKHRLTLVPYRDTYAC